jgi:adenosylmethionine-8-amino-7-oxononanoate aminotransferase
MPSLPGYLQAMEEVCRDFGALFIVDEIMCGFGRCGKLHAWEGENVTPDIQVMGKGLAGGQREISALLVGGLAQEQFLIDALRENGTNFNHGHTFQNNPPACAAALEALGIVLELLPNVQKMGALLKKRLIAKIGHLPFVGNIRGEGLFLGVSHLAFFAIKANVRRSSSF